MNKTIYIFIAIIIAGAIGFILFAPKSDSPSTFVSSQNTTINQALTDVAAGKAVLFDVRTPDEFNGGHAKLATNFDSVRLQNGEQFPANKNQTIYLYCRSGNRASQVQAILKNRGYTSVTNLGGLDEMKAAGAF